MQWEQDLEKAISDVDAQSTASSDAALMIGLDRVSAAGTDNNTMSGISSESGQQQDGSSDQLYAETPDDDEDDRHNLYHAYMKEMDDDKLDQSGMEDYNQTHEEDTFDTVIDSQRTLQEKDESKDTLFSEAEYSSPQSHFDEILRVEELHERSTQGFEESSKILMREVSASQEHEYQSQHMESHMHKQSVFSENHAMQETCDTQKTLTESSTQSLQDSSYIEKASHFQKFEENFKLSSEEHHESSHTEEKFQLSSSQERYDFSSENKAESYKYSENSELEVSWAATHKQLDQPCDTLATQPMEGELVAHRGITA